MEVFSMKIYSISLFRLKKILRPVSVVAFTLCLVAVAWIAKDTVADIVTPASAVSPRVIVVDAGHGGEDSGTVGTNGIFEKNLNLEIALQIAKLLGEKGFTVVLTRQNDELLLKSEEEKVKGLRKISDLKNRVAVAASYKDAIFVSVHMNSFGESKYSGTQVFAKPADEGSRRLAEAIRASVAKDLQPDNKRQVKEGKDIYVLENAPYSAVLIECGFLSNPDECAKLCEKEYQKQLCFAIVCGMMEVIQPENPS